VSISIDRPDADTQRRPVEAALLGGAALERGRIKGLLLSAGFTLPEPEESSDPEVILLLPTEAGVGAIVGELRSLRRSYPDAHILAIMPAEAPNPWLRRVMLAGATGIVLDDELERTLVPTARATLAGQLAVPSALGRQIAPRPLSYREKEILALVMRGRTNHEIAAELFLAESTIKTHLSSAFRKLDARSRAEAITRITDPETGFGAGILEIANESAAPSG
jgi:DNA-binding NarL/FixJ family response regulator